MLLHRGWYSILCRHDVLQQDCSKTRALEVGDRRRLVLPQNLHWNGVVLGEVDPSLDLVAPQVLHLPLLGRVHLSRPSIIAHPTSSSSSHVKTSISSSKVAT